MNPTQAQAVTGLRMPQRKPISPPLLLAMACLGAYAAEPSLHIEPGVELGWSTVSGSAYHAQWAPDPGGPWTDLGGEMAGDGLDATLYDPAPVGARQYQVLETVPGTAPVPSIPVNGGFETGSGTTADHWSTGAGQPPVRTGDDAHSGSFTMRCALENVGAAPAEGLLSQFVAVAGGRSYDFSFWAKQLSIGPSYVQQYEVQWLNSSKSVIGSSGLSNFSGTEGVWQKISRPGLIAPAAAVEAKVSFRFVTGAVVGGHGEVLVDDVALETEGGSSPGTPEETHAIEVAVQPVAMLSWPTFPGVQYQPASSPDLAIWENVTAPILGDGGTAAIMVPMSRDAEFFRVAIPVVPVLPPQNLQAIASGPPNAITLVWDASPSPGVTGYRVYYGVSGGGAGAFVDVGDVTTATIPDLLPGETYVLSVVALAADGESAMEGASLTAVPNGESSLVALFNAATVPEPAISEDTPAALITRIADRARDRHAREAQFNSYDHYLSWYWEQRMANIEIIDRIGKAGQPQNITFNYTTQDLLNPAEFRTFFRGIGTVAEYNNNQIATLVSTNPSATPGETDYHYTATITQNGNEGNRALQLGDRVEIEISMFLNGPRNGRLNYYGTTLLYIVGQGIVPWAQGNDLGFPGGIVGNVNKTLDSHPLPTKAWLGGLTTLPYQYSNEPEHRFKQTAGNISPTSGQPFMSGRRLHHTDFGNGVHSEPNNPVFTAHVGKLGPKFIARSCVECHTNNGRALPPAIGAPMLRTVMKTGADADGSPHSSLGSVLQPQITSGAAEGSATIASYTFTNGQYGDSTAYSLRKPNYAFQGAVPTYFSARLAPQLVGLGLLEAVAEDSIIALEDPDDADGDGISGRIQTVTDPETGEPRLGRFTSKGGKARLSHQIAGALNTDMGVTTTIFPVLDGESSGGAPELGDAELADMTRYIALLGVGARRDLSDAQALRGEELFTTARCVACHVPELQTGPYHPMAELRNQTIHPYTDLLLHDMGLGLADNMGEDGASGSEWRTPPLWNIGLTAGVSGGEAYLHDGRARNLEEAILWHGGEAEASKESFRTMPAADRAAIIKFLKSL